MRIIRESFLFGVSGVVGFVVDTTVLYVLKDDFGLFVARLFSFFSAVIVTWLFNRAITFKSRRSGMRRSGEFAAYFMLMLAGGVVSYSFYAWLVIAYEIVAAHPVIGVGAGSVAGMFVNLATSRWLLFRRPAAEAV